MNIHRAWFLALVLLPAACSPPPAAHVAMHPEGSSTPPARAAVVHPPADLTLPGAVARGSTPAEIIDTRLFNPQVQPAPLPGEPRLVKTILPPHEKPTPAGAGPLNSLIAGTTLDEPRTVTDKMFPTIGATGWNPPDPCIAVGPNHVVVTVNMTVAFYNKSTGAEQFRVSLSDAGSPGFFEPLGAGNFTFDPKCLYDHISGRFVILALETYANQAWIDIAISDDSDPNGVWYKYRTDAVLTVGAYTYWWDYPGLGYDANAYYVTGNLFSLNNGPYGGAGFRVFTKAPLLTGAAATYSTLRDSGGYTIQPAKHYGSPTNPYFCYIVDPTTVRIYSITNPLTAPVLVNTNVAVPSYNGSVNAPTVGGGSMSTGGSFDPVWRDGGLYWAHNASISGRNTVRWHQFATGTWPASGTVTRVQSGDVDAGPGKWTMFPAISVNAAHDVGMVAGVTGTDYRVGVAVAGRRSADALGRFGVPVLVKDGEVNTNGRYGDYYSIGIDPVDDTTFWVVGEYPTAGSWQNWVTSFRVTDQSQCHPVPDDAGIFQSATPRTIDVLANDWHSTGLTMTIQNFDAVTTRGGTVARSVGTGPGGRDQLIYTPVVTDGLDSFNYVVRDSGGNTAAAAVTAHLYNPANYRNPENPAFTRAGINAAWYTLSAPTALPNFAALTPYLTTLVPNLNYASTNGNIANSGAADNVGAVFDGYVNIPATDLYQFYVNSDDGSKCLLGATVIVNNDGAHGMTDVGSSLVGLKVGKHHVVIQYFEATGGAGVIASYSSQTFGETVIPTTRWWATAPCVADIDDGTSSGHPDGGVTIDDLLFYLTLFSNGDIRADMDDGSGTGIHDQGVTIDDLLFYLSRFSIGC